MASVSTTTNDPWDQFDPQSLGPLPRELWPSIDHIITEDETPVDGVFSEKQMRLLTETLHTSWKVDRPFVAFANVGLFYGVDPPVIVPDVLLSVDVKIPKNLFPKLHRSYFVWAYGKPPDIAIEIVSNKRGGEDSDKLQKYRDARVSNYFIYDPECHLSKTVLRWFQLVGSEYEPVTDKNFFIKSIGLGLKVWHGTFENVVSDWLRWVDERGKLIQTGAEFAKAESRHAALEKRRAETEKQRAEDANERAETEKRRAESEKLRADEANERAEAASREKNRLLELLRRHGLESEAD